MNHKRPKVVIRGGGDLATAVVQKLFRSGYDVVVCEVEAPTMIRRTVSLANAVYESRQVVEDIEAVWCSDYDQLSSLFMASKIPVVNFPDQDVIKYLKADVFIDATMSKKKVAYGLDYAPIVIGLGPEIIAGENAHVVVETARGHDLGRLIFDGKAEDNTHVPGTILEMTYERVVHAPCAGTLSTTHKIGDLVSKGDLLLKIDDCEVEAEITGVLRGLIHPLVPITKGLKIADIDPRNDQTYCMTISDKGRNIAGGVLEAIMILSQ